MAKYQKKVVIIGGNDAGLSAAGRAKRLDPSLDITVLEKGEFVGYASCSFPYFISGDAQQNDVCGPSKMEIEKKRNIKIKLLTEAQNLNLRNHQVFAVENGKDQIYKYDRLVLATGALPVVPKTLKSPARNVFVLRNFEDAKKINDYILSSTPLSALVVGSGYLGIEMAEALKKRHINVKVIDNNRQFLSKYLTEISDIILSKIKENSVNLFLDEEITNIHIENNIVRSVELRNSGVYNVDLIIIAAGIRPNVQLAEDAGIPLGSTGAIAVNNRQETKRLNVLAVGDCAESRNVVCKKNMWLPFAGIASKQGRVAGSNLAGKIAAMPNVAGTSMIKAFGLEFGHTGLDWQQVFKAGFDPAYTVINHKSKPAFMNGSCDMTVVLIGDKRSKKLLGAQMVGERDIGMRLNIIATALAGSLTVQDMEFMDFGYTPPITNLWDPIAIAANSLQKKLKR